MLTFLAAFAISAAIGIAAAASAEASGSVKISRYDAAGALMTSPTTTASVSPSTTGSQTANPATFAQAGGLITISTTDLPGYTERYRFCTALITATQPFPDCSVGGFTNDHSLQINAGFNDFVKVWFNYVADGTCTSCGGSPPRCHGGDNSTNTIEAEVGKPRAIRGEDGTGVYAWSAPSGSLSSSTGQNVNVTYNSAGTYTVTVADPLGRTGTCKVHAAVTQPPSCGASPNPAKAGQQVTITGSNDPNAQYNFSGGESPPSQDGGSSFKTTFSTRGDKTINVYARSTGLSGSCIVTVTDPDPVRCAKGDTPYEGAVGAPVTVRAENGNGTYNWTAVNDPLASPQTGTGQDFRYVPTSSGRKTLRVDSAGTSANCYVDVIKMSDAPARAYIGITGGLYYKAAKYGQENRVEITRLGALYRIRDWGVPRITPLSGCTATPDPQVVTCRPASMTSRIAAYLYDLGDNLNLYHGSSKPEGDTVTAKAYIYGGDGDDVLDGGAGDDVVRGQRNNDTITGDSGVNLLDGSTGNDYLYSQGDAEDKMYPGSDVDYLDGKDNDNSDIVKCSSDGADFYRADRGDTLYSSCLKTF